MYFYTKKHTCWMEPKLYGKSLEATGSYKGMAIKKREEF
jgi:hypothetical protein